MPRQQQHSFCAACAPEVQQDLAHLSPSRTWSAQRCWGSLGPLTDTHVQVSIVVSSPPSGRSCEYDCCCGAGCAWRHRTLPASLPMSRCQLAPCTAGPEVHCPQSPAHAVQVVSLVSSNQAKICWAQGNGSWDPAQHSQDAGQQLHTIYQTPQLADTARQYTNLQQCQPGGNHDDNTGVHCP